MLPAAARKIIVAKNDAELGNDKKKKMEEACENGSEQ